MGYFKNTVLNQDGVLDVDVKDVCTHAKAVKLIDVRRPDEYTGELGHIDGASLMTLESEFVNEIANQDRNATIVFVCRSGGRSSRAAVYAKSLGFADVYNMAGGMIEWNHQKLPLAE